MKRIIYFILILSILITILCSCGNMSIGLGEHEFKHIHVTDHIDSHCFEIKNWYDGGAGIEVKTPEGTIFASEGTYQLFESEDLCPYCN